MKIRSTAAPASSFTNSVDMFEKMRLFATISTKSTGCPTTLGNGWKPDQNAHKLMENSSKMAQTHGKPAGNQ